MGETNKQCDAGLMGTEKEMVNFKDWILHQSEKRYLERLSELKKEVLWGFRKIGQYFWGKLSQRSETVGNKNIASLANHL